MKRYLWTHCTECGCELTEETRYIQYRNKGKANEETRSSQLCKTHKTEMMRQIRNKSYHSNKPPLRIKKKVEVVKSKKKKEIMVSSILEHTTKDFTIKENNPVKKEIQDTGRLTGRAAVERVIFLQEERKKIKEKPMDDDKFVYDFTNKLSYT